MKDIALPDFQCAAYRRQLPQWQRLDDLFTGSSAWTNQADGRITPNDRTPLYLPRFAKEHSKDYEARLVRTPYSDRFAQAIKDFVGLIFHNDLRFSEEFPPILQEHFTSVDGEGTNAVVLFSQMAIACMRRGHTFVMVDCPNSNHPSTLASQKAIRPYWVHIHPQQVLSWRSVVYQGKRHLTQVVIQQTQMVPAGAFGEQEVKSYLVLRPGRYDTYTIAVEPNSSTRHLVHHPERSGIHGIIRNGKVEPFKMIPLACIYGGLKTGLFESEPPLNTLADLNLTHYQMYSDHLSKIHYCCFPTPVRVGMMAEEDDLILGPGVTVDVPPGGAFLWAEPSATSIAESRKEIEALELAMDFLGTQFLVKPSDRQAAMVSLVQAAKVESTLDLFARSFAQGINQALTLHAAYLDIAPGTISLDTSFFQQNNTDTNLLHAFTTLYDRLLAYPEGARRSLLNLAQRRGFIPPEIDIDAELLNLQKDHHNEETVLA
jgi:hypothetical protein